MKNWETADQAFAWFVGLFEGDGSFNTVKGGRTHLGVDLTDPDIVYHLQDLFGGKVYGPSWKNAKGSMNVKPMYQWRLHTQADVWPIIDRMYPYLCDRRKERVDSARLAYELGPKRKPRASKPRIDGAPIAKAELKVV